MSQLIILSLFLFTVLATLAGAIWELLGITKNMRDSGDPHGDIATRMAIEHEPDGSAVVRRRRPAWLDVVAATKTSRVR